MKNNKWRVEFELIDAPLLDDGEDLFTKPVIKQIIKDIEFSEAQITIKKLKVTKV
jgi:hypothetical protein